MNRKRVIITSFATLLLCGVAILVFLRWEAWFGNPVEPRFYTSQEPTHILLTMGQDASIRIVSWQCDSIKRNAFIEYFHCDTSQQGHHVPSKSLAESKVYTSQGGTSVFYRAEIPIQHNGVHYYRICQEGLEPTPWHRFAVPYMSDKQLNFVYIGDVQDSIGGITGTTTQDIVTRHPESELFILGGDLIHRPHEAYWDEAFAGIHAFASTYTTLATTGNHEYVKGIAKKSEERFPLHFSYFLETYSNNGFCYYTLRYDHAEFFFIDSNCNIIDLIKQRGMLKKAFAQSTAQWKIVVLHHPPYSIRRNTNNLPLRWLLAPLLKECTIDLVLCGHEHGYARIEPHDTPPVYIISHCSPKVYRHKNSEIATVYHNSDRYYQHITIVNDTLSATTRTANGEIIDELTMVKNSENQQSL